VDQLDIDRIIQAYRDGVISEAEAVSRLMFDHDMRLHDAEILVQLKPRRTKL
jgi:hypothetical protein